MTKLETSKAQQEVWQWKDAGYREVAHLPRRAALLKRLDDAHQTAVRLAVEMPPMPAPRRLMVAEEQAEYNVGAKRKRGETTR